MWRRLLLIGVLTGISTSLLSAQKISTDYCCLNRNAARIAQSLITMYGDSCVEQMLDNNVQFVAVWKLDTLNHVVGVTDFLKEHQVFLEMCYAYEDSGIKDYIEQEMREGKADIRTLIVFPGKALYFYDSQQESAREQSNNLTRLDYVKQYIKKHLPDGLQSDR